MGVTGLWKLIEPCGKPVPVETLEGKVLAIDISIWLHQVIKGFQDNKGSALPNAHLLGLFHRLCKLLYYRVKPVFIFDGSVPQLKKDTIYRRQQQRSKLNTEADRIQALLLQSLAKEKVVQQALGANAEQLLKSPSKRPRLKANAREDVDDMFKLPDLPAKSKNVDHTESKDDSTDCSFNSHGTCDDSNSTDESSSFDESNARNFYNANLQAIDVKSQHFKDLPADVRHEILVDIKETRKQSSWGRLHELPSRGDDFSTFQMKRLLKRRAVQESLEEAEQEMGGSTLTYAELTNMFTEEGILEANVLDKGMKPLLSDEHTRFLLVRDLKKKLLKPEEKVPIVEKVKEEAAPSIRKKSIDTVKIVDVEEQEQLGNEFGTELQLALAMSLEETQVYSESDYNYESNEQLKLNAAQRNRLKNAAIGPARAYMIEYGGMNEEEVEGIMEKTQIPSDCDESFEEVEGILEKIQLNSNCDKSSQRELKESRMENENSTISNEKNTEGKPNQIENTENKQSESDSQEICLRMSDTDTDTDTDLEEVVEETDVTDSKGNTESDALKPELEVVVDLKDNIAPDDDLFADIFETETEINDITIEKPKIDIIEKNPNTSIEESNEKVLKTCPETLEQQNSPNEESKKTVAESILSNLKLQLDEVKNIKLDDIQIASTVIEVSDDESQKKIIPCESFETAIKSEIIEICDSDDALSGSAKPDAGLKTPRKTSILEYYQADYVVKRTPDKPKEDETEDVPKVKSPFFVNKTPKSSRKSFGKDDTSQSPSPKKSASKASKSLFGNEVNEENKEETEIEGIEPLKITPLNTEDLIKEAAQQLKDQKTDSELQEMASDLARERLILESERNRQDRMGMSISQRMSTECQELLKLFGIPYIVAPMEAEAQCAFLDSIELTNGTITDDSDIWLFGGRTVYKNFFAQNKHVLEFRAEKIKNSFNCDRNKLIQLACLVGSDYTTGVNGIGAVTALEILAAFTNNEKNLDNVQNSEKNMRDIIMSVLQSLNKFREWWLAHKSNSTSPPGSSTRLALRKKLKNIELHDGFPSLAVVEAYLAPKVDESRDKFSWGYPDVESIREYAKKTFGWTTIKTNEILMPVLKRLNDKKLQATIRSYFTTKSAISPRDIKVSKRVQMAIDRMSGKIEAETPERPTTSKAKRPVRKKKVQRARQNEEGDDLADSAINAETVDKICPSSSLSSEIAAVEEQATTSKKAAESNRKRTAPNLHNKTTDLIPQREKDKAKLLENKAKAAEIFKNAAKAESPAKKKKRKA